MLTAIIEWCSHFLPVYFITRDAGICEVPQQQIAEYLSARAEVHMANLERNKEND